MTRKGNKGSGEDKPEQLSKEGRQARAARTATGEGPEAPEWTKMVDRVRLNSVKTLAVMQYLEACPEGGGSVK